MNRLLFPALIAPLVFAQSGLVPLESVTLEGTTVSRNSVLAIAGLHLGSPIDKSLIEEACAKLQGSGLFGSINYKYAPAPKGGIALTLSLADPAGLTAASIDIPGENESETWEWLKRQFPRFDHKVPNSPGAQEYLAKSLAQHLGDTLRGQPLVPRMESEITTGRMLVSFQPETLPKIAAMSFTGQQEIPPEKLNSILAKYAATQGYADRGFRELVELNLRPAYEEHGMYRVKFPAISMVFVNEGAVSVTTSIEEGPKYKLGAVTVSGDAPSPGELLDAAGFKKGELANWAEIQKSLNAAEKPLMRGGFLRERVHPQRAFDDDQHILNLNLQVAKGPLFHFGAVRFQGSLPIWKPRRTMFGP